MKKAILASVFVSLISSSLFATAQLPNNLIYKGESYLLYTNPLESYFNEHPEKKPEAEILSTNLWRGYLATFEIIDGIMYVKDIQIKVRPAKLKAETMFISVIDEVFPTREERKLDWYNGLLLIPMGEVVQYVHMGYATEYEKYMLMEIVQGNLTEERTYSNEEYKAFKVRQYNAFAKTEEFKTAVEQRNAANVSEDEIKMIIQDFILDYTTRFLAE